MMRTSTSEGDCVLYPEEVGSSDGRIDLVEALELYEH